MLYKNTSPEPASVKESFTIAVKSSSKQPSGLCHVTDGLSVRYLGNDSLSGLVVLEEEVVGLDEELAGVFLGLGHPLLPQQHGLVKTGLGVELLEGERETELVE